MCISCIVIFVNFVFDVYKKCKKIKNKKIEIKSHIYCFACNILITNRAEQPKTKT